MPLPAFLIPLLLGGAGFLTSGGIDKLGRQFNRNLYDNPSFGEWAGTAGSTAMGAITPAMRIPFMTKTIGELLGQGAGWAAPRMGAFGVGTAFPAARAAIPPTLSFLGRNPYARAGLGYTLGGGIGTTKRLLDRDPTNNPGFFELLAPAALAFGGYKMPNLARVDGRLGRVLPNSLGPMPPSRPFSQVPPETMAPFREMDVIAMQKALDALLQMR